jgi:hypothetical protein
LLLVLNCHKDNEFFIYRWLTRLIFPTPASILFVPTCLLLHLYEKVAIIDTVPLPMRYDTITPETPP